MIMYNKGQNYTILKETYKVPQTSLEALKNLGVTLKIGDTAIELLIPAGLSKTHSFNTLVSNTVKNPQPEHIVQVNAFVSSYISLAQQSVVQSIPAEPKIKPVAAKVTQSDVDKLPVVQLRDATALYQRVHGTSGGSIYRVVALNDKLKMAARIKGTAVSLRIEGVLDSSSVKAFEALGISKKSDEYMSGHFTCEKCTPQKLIGSILVGSGVPFDSPIPVISDKVFS